jgi:hypothetical protein
VVGAFKKTSSGVKLDRVERRKVMALAQARLIDAVLVTELPRAGRSTTDLLATLKKLEARRVSVIAPGAHPLQRRCGEGARQAPRPPSRAAAEIRPACAKGPGADRQGPQLSLHRPGSGFEQKHRCRLVKHNRTASGGT